MYHVNIRCPEACAALVSAGHYRSLKAAKIAACELSNHLNIHVTVWNAKASKLEAHYKPCKRWLTLEDGEIAA